MQEFIKDVIPSQIKNMQIEIDEFLKLYNNKECELLDIRVVAETKVWQLNFGLKIPAPELAERLDELPKDKLIVVACPRSNRSNMVRTWLAIQGFEARYLSDGLLGLMNHLKGGGVKDINL